MNATDKVRTIAAVKAKAPATLSIRWSDGVRARIDLSALLLGRAFKRLHDVAEFARVRSANGDTASSGRPGSS
jgi:hypothetical protein